MQQSPSTLQVAGDKPAERPILFLGLVGFSVGQLQRLSDLVGRATSHLVRWQLCGFAEADAWWVNGSRTQLLADRSLRIASGVAGGRSVQLSLPEVDRPIAFSEPIGPRQFEPAWRFKLEDEAGMQLMLATFERWLRALSSQQCLAAQVMQHEKELSSNIYHVIGDGRLLAVVDVRGDVGIAPGASPFDFGRAVWSSRPPSAGYIPENFTRLSLSLLMWQYAMRTSRDLLPDRYRLGPIYFRRPPRLAQGLLRDEHLVLMRELAYGPLTFEELQQRTGLVDARLARDLAALYLVGSITANPMRAGQTNATAQPSDCQDSTRGSTHSGLPSRPTPDSRHSGWMGGLWRADPTTPAPLRA